MLIESTNPNVVAFKEVIDPNQGEATYSQTQHRLLESRSLAKKTITALNLWELDELGGNRVALGAASVEGVDTVGAWGRTKLWLKGLIRPAAADTSGLQLPEPTETPAESRVVDRFLSQLVISPIRGSRIVEIRFQSTDPLLAAAIANAHARAYIEQDLAYRFATSKEASSWLGQQLADLRKQVEGSELAVQRYVEQQDAVSLDERQDIVAQKLGDLNSAVTKVKTTRIEKEALYRQLLATQNDQNALDSIPAVLSNGFIQQLKSELVMLQRQQAQLSETHGPKHPEFIKVQTAVQTAEAKLRGEIGKVVNAIKNEYLAAQAQERSLVDALEDQKREALAVGRKGVEYGVLRREAESSRQIYNSLLQRVNETGVTGDLKTSNLRIIDEAERPRNPFSPNRQLNLIMGFLGGLVLALGLAFFFEYLDNRIKSPEEIKAHLGLASLGMVPVIRTDQAAPLISGAVPPGFAEAFRVVRTNVMFSTAESGCRSIAVTSTRSGEGKTVVAANLAIGFAQAGQRVLLIDCDLRRPRTHELLGQHQEPGLSNLLVGQSKASEVVRKTDVPGLWVMTAGKIPPNPAELVGSPRMRDLLKSLGDHFDWIVLDTPPVMAVADSAVLAHMVSGVVFVIGAEMTSRHAAGAALEQLEAARARFVGGILNKVNLEANPYYYSKYYRREYAEYYTRSAAV